MHYRRLRRHGRLTTQPVTLRGKILRCIDPYGDCPTWIGPTDTSGRPRLRWQGRVVRPDKVLFEWAYDRRLGAEPLLRLPGCHPQCVDPTHGVPASAAV